MDNFLLFWGAVFILIGIIVASKAHKDQNLLKIFGIVLIAIGVYLLLVGAGSLPPFM